MSNRPEQSSFVQQVPCPRRPQCLGVLRYELADRGHGYVATCQRSPDWGGGCGSDYWWDAHREEWEPSGPR
jgi:hypothetical protein